jgi:hypothetical protein
VIDQQDHALETYKGLIQLGQSVLCLLSILNGGAAIAILAFVGDALPSSQEISITGPILLFVAGLGLAGATAVVSYIMQLRLYGETIGTAEGNLHSVWLKIAIVLSVLSLIAFCVGAVWAAIELTSLTKCEG